MPVVSPHRSSASALGGSYRSSVFNSALDRPTYYSTTFSNSRPTTYTERFSSRSYTDSDGRRVFSRSGSITEDGVTTRYREDSRDKGGKRDSLSRDSGISSSCESSANDYTRRDRDSSLSRDSSRLSSSDLQDTLTDLRNKYSPSNYVPAIHRKNDNITRSKSINDIGLPPIDKVNKKKVNDSLNFNNMSALSNTTNDNCSLPDDNGNRASVADLCKRFDKANNKLSKTTPIYVEGAEIKLSDHKFKMLDENKFKLGNSNEKLPNGIKIAKISKINEKNVDGNKRIKVKIFNGIRSNENDEIKVLIVKHNSEVNRDSETNATKVNLTCLDDKTKLQLSKDHDTDNLSFKINSDQTKLTNGLDLNGTLDISDDVNDVDDAAEVQRENDVASVTVTRSVSRTNDFASYIPSKDFERGDDEKSTSSISNFESENGTISVEEQDHIKKPLYSNDLAASPKINRTNVSPASTAIVGVSSNNLNSNSLVRRSVDRDRRSSTFDEEIYERPGYRLSGASNAVAGTKTLGLNGLKNIGNTCFMNSVIQCLSNTKLLLEYVRKDGFTKDINTTISGMKGALIRAFAEVIKELWSEDSYDRVVNTVSLKSQIQRFAPRFMGYAQQDAQEFLRYLLEGLHEDVNRITQKPKPIHTEIDEKLSDVEKSAEAWNRYLRMDNSRIVDIFVGQLKSTLKCTYCGHCSVTFDPFWDLSLPIPQRTGQLRLSQCLESFTREETLDGDEKPTCSKCKERRKCTKSFSIQKFPKILVIHLKRFSPTERYRGKLSVTVDFPLEGLDMTKYAAEGVSTCRYNLYAVSNHSGTTYSGHYTAHCRHPYTQGWHEYNDSRVSSASPRSVVSGEAYVLFYEQEGQRAHL